MNISIKCFSCDHKHNLVNCPKCGMSGGYVQLPLAKSIGTNLYKLEDVLIHKQTNNKYTIKEFQSSGIIAVVLHANPAMLIGRRTYIRNESLEEYE